MSTFLWTSNLTEMKDCGCNVFLHLLILKLNVKEEVTGFQQKTPESVNERRQRIERRYSTTVAVPRKTFVNDSVAWINPFIQTCVCGQNNGAGRSADWSGFGAVGSGPLQGRTLMVSSDDGLVVWGRSENDVRSWTWMCRQLPETAESKTVRTQKKKGANQLLHYSLTLLE